MPTPSNRIVQSPTGRGRVNEVVETLKLLKSDFTVEIPANTGTNGGKMFKTLALLCYVTRTFEIHPVDEKDPILGHPNEFPKEDDDTGWDKYLFNRRRANKGRKEFDVAHLVISASQSLNAMKKHKSVINTLKKDGIYIRAREFTNHSEKVPIGWLCGINPAMSGKENILNALKQQIVDHSRVVDNEIVIESTRIRQTIPKTGTVAHTTAWMVYGNQDEANDIETCLRGYLCMPNHEVALGLRNCIFVPASRSKTDLTIKVLRIRKHNEILNNTASVEINNVYPNDNIRYDERIADFFDHYAEGELDSLKVSLRELLDEQLENFTAETENTEHDRLVEENTDYHTGVKDMYFHRGNFHVSCQREYVNRVVRGMRTALQYMAMNLDEAALADICSIRNIGHWNYPKVGAVHTYDDQGITRTTVDVNAPDDLSALEVTEFISSQGISYDTSFQHG